jgi:arylsulfatase A-like enzyme
MSLLGCTRELQAPNVVLIVIDTLRRDHVGFHGHDPATSPTLDALAAESLVVEDASANAPWTKPAVGTIFTSLMPAKHRAIHESPKSGLADEFLTLAEVFRQAGYRTGGFVENPNVHRTTGFAQGFEVFRNPGFWTRTKRATIEGAVDWLEAEGEGQAEPRPFFLFLHFLDPHTPYFAPVRFRERFTQGHQAENAWAREGRVSEILMNMDPAELAPEDVAMLKALYDAEIRWVDVQVGAFLRHLEAQGLRDDTILLVTSDHGEEFLENGRLAHGPWLSVELLRIPLLLHVPGLGARRVDHTGVSQLDIAPTLLELAAISIPPAFEGESFAGLARGEAPQERSVRAETHNAGTHLRSVREGSWKLVRDERAGTRRLYDLASDPGEDRDLALANPERVAQLESRLERVSPEESLPSPEAEGPVDEALEQGLRALGYLQEPEPPIRE